MDNYNYAVVDAANAHGDGGNSGGADDGAYLSDSDVPNNRPGSLESVYWDFRKSDSSSINKRWASLVIFGGKN